MAILLVFGGIALFSYVATNIGADKRPGHQAMGIQPMLWTLLICFVVGVLMWPTIGPLATWLLGPIMHNLNR